MLEIIRHTIKTFCIDFVNHPYLCYTEHGQHALFYTSLYSNLPPENQYDIWHKNKVCIIQKEYPTATKLFKPKRQHWDIAVLSQPLTSQSNDASSYDYLNLFSAVEFGLNEAKKHLVGDLKRLTHHELNVEHGIIVHLYRLSKVGEQFSGRDWSPNSKRILTIDQVSKLSKRYPVEIFYGMADNTGKYENGVWSIKNGQISKIKNNF